LGTCHGEVLKALDLEIPAFFLDAMENTVPKRRRTTWFLFFSHQALLICAMVRTLVLVPVYLRFISEETFGAWLAISGAMAILGLADFGLPGLMMQRIAHLLGARSFKLLGRTVVSALVFVSGLAGFLILLMWTVSPWLPGWFKLAQDIPDLVLAFRLAAVDAGLLLLVFTTGDILVGWHHPRPYMAGQAFSQGLGIMVTLAGLYRGWGVVALPVGLLTGTLLTLAVNLISLGGLLRQGLPRGSLRFDFPVLRDVLKSASYLVVTRACRVLAFRVQGVIILTLISAPAVVVFEVTRRAALTVGDMVNRLPMSLLPGLAHLKGSQEEVKFQKIAMSLLLTAGVAGFLSEGGVFLFNREFVRLWVGEAFYGGAGLNFLVALGMLLSIVNAALFNIIFARGNFGLITLVSLVEAMLLVSLAVLWGSIWNLEGVALAAVVGGLVALGIQGLGIQKYFDLPFARSQLAQMGKGLGMLTLYLLVALPLTVKWPPQGWWQLSLGAASYLLAGSLMLVSCNSQVRQLVVAHFTFGRWGRLLT
jgi:O-antigen/teichoic acid export membrane protein